MTNVLRWALGLDVTPEQLQDARWRIELLSQPTGWAAVVLIVLALLTARIIWGLYRREGREVPLSSRMLLSGIRICIFLTLAIMLMEISLVLTRTEKLPSHLLVLVDGSQSMGLPDPYTDATTGTKLAEALELRNKEGKLDLNEVRKKTRLELADKGLSGIEKELAGGRKIYWYRFGDKLESRDSLSATTAGKPSSEATAVGDAIRKALAEHRGQPIAGVVVATDGQSNSGEEPLKTAEIAGKDGVKIFPIATGTLEGPRNARMVEVAASPVVFVKDPFEVSLVVESRGMKDQRGTMILEERKDDGPWKEIGSQEIIFGGDSGTQRVTFPYTADLMGKVDFRGKIIDAGPELTDADNTSTTSVKVVRQKIRVLLVAGNPSFEMQFMRNALLRDTGLEFSAWLQSADKGYDQGGDRPIRRLPATQQELDQYDVLIMMDPDVKQLGTNWPEMIVKFVGDAGGGFIYVAGEVYSAQLFNPEVAGGAGIDNSWLKVLPIVRDPGLYQSEAEVRLSSRETYNLELTPQGYEDQVFRFSPDPNKNRQLIGSLPGMFWHFPVTRAKPGATVLASHGDPRMKTAFGRHVLLATHLYGPGRSVFVGFDTTYRWRYLHEDYFDGFWARLIDRVGRSKVLGGRYPFVLSTDKDTYRVGERVRINARFPNQADSSSMPALTGEVETAGKQPTTIDMEPSIEESGALQSTFIPHDPGVYAVRVLPVGQVDPTAGPRAATISFRVEAAKKEIDNPTLNQSLLDGLARASGGKVFSLANIRQLPDEITMKEVDRTIELRDEIWDAPILYAGIIVLLTVEWLIRKKYRMA